MYQSLCDFIKKEFSDLDHRAETNGKLTMQEVQYADMLAHFYKNLLTAEAMEDSGSYEKGYGRSYNDGYSDGYNDGYSRSGNHEDTGYGARGRGKGARRDSMGRYADDRSGYSEGSDGGYRHGRSIMSELHELMENAPNEQIKHKYKDFISEIQSMM